MVFIYKKARGNQYFNDVLMIFGGWLTRGFASLCRPVAGLRGSPRPPINTFPAIRCFDGSIVRCLDAGGWLELSAGGWLMLSQLWPLCMLVQKGCWLASMLCLGSHTHDALRGRRINVLESPEGCCEDICMFFNRNNDGFRISRRLL